MTRQPSATPATPMSVQTRYLAGADESLPTTPAGLLALASYASALCWLTESLAELTVAVDHVRTGNGPDGLPTLVRSLLAWLEAAG